MTESFRKVKFSLLKDKPNVEREETLVLLDRAKTGDHQAFGKLWSEHERSIKSTISYILGHGNSEIPDVVQLVALKAWRNLAQHTGDITFSTWLHVIAQRTCVDHLKKEKRRGQAVPVDQANHLPGQSFSYTALDALWTAEEMLTQLGEVQQRIVRLVLWEGQSSMDVADVLGISGTQAYETIRSFRRQLRHKVESSESVLNKTSASFAAENIVISAIVQTANEELMRWLQKHPDDLLRVHEGTFEQIVAEIFRDQGFDVEVLGSWNQADGGIDIIAVRKDSLAGSFRVGIQCKRYVKTQTVRADQVWALEGRLDKFKLNKGVLATTAVFEKSVLLDLKDHLWRLELHDFEMLKKDLQSWGLYQRGSGGLWLPKP